MRCDRWSIAAKALPFGLSLALLAACASGPDGEPGDDQADVGGADAGGQDAANTDDAEADSGGEDVVVCPQDEPCDDDNACTDKDTCDDEGKCRGVPVVCDDDNPCTKDMCDPASGCTHPKKIGLGCSDGDPCTVADACKAGKCEPGQAVVCPDGGACETLSCDPKTGSCSKSTPAADGTACDSQHPCLVGGACAKAADAKSACVATLKDCDDANPCTVDACGKDGKCVGDGAKAAKQTCDDGDPCTVGDACDGKGACQAGKARDCDDGNPCTQGACEAKTGACVSAPLIDGKTCTPTHPCVPDGACEKGACVGTPKSCDDGNPCTVDSCDKAGKCVHDAAKSKGAPCTDNDLCTSADACDGKAACKGGKAPDCGDDNPCTADACDKAKGCTNSAQAGKSCDDGDKCSAGDKCDDKGACKAGKGVCACQKDADCGKHEDGNLCNGTLECDLGTKTCAVDPPTVVTCTDAGACELPVCDTKTGKCGTKAGGDGKACDDANPCTHADTCKAGKCAGGKLDCDDANTCTTDSCDPGGKGCLHKAAAGPCNADDDACTVGDFCAKGACLPGKATACDDGDVCTTDACDAKSGKCLAGAGKDGLPCDADASACTVADTCKAGKCVPGAAPKCDDANPCTEDACDPKSGCTHTPATGSCDADGDPCTVDDACYKGVCIPGKARLCDDGAICTVDACDTNDGKCVTSAGKDGVLCDADGDVCTAKDACKAGKCVAGPKKVCSDGNPCTDDACHPLKGCRNQANEAPCDDASVCTALDLCAGGKCLGGKPKSCDDNNECTKDSCDAKQGCVHTPTAGCVPKPKTWTVLVYMAADNNLESAALEDIDEMLAAKDGDNLRFVVQIDRSTGFSAKAISGAGDFSTTRRLVIQSGKGGKRELLNVADLGETDTGDPKHLQEFIAWGATTFPADHVALVLWNHGQAWQGIAGDDGAGDEHWLLLPAMQKALKAGLAQAKLKEFAFVGFDACLMGGLVVANAVQGTTRYMIASEDLEPGHGWDYRSFGAVVGNPASGPEQLGKAVLDGYLAHAKSHKQGASVTLAMLDLKHLAKVEGAVQGLTKAMGADMAKIAKKIGSTRSRVQEFGRSPNPEQAYFMVDLGDLATEIATEAPQLGKLKDQLLQGLAGMILHKISGPVTKRATGMAVYFPPTSKLYRKPYDGVDGIGAWRTTLTGFHKTADKQGVVPKLQKVKAAAGGTKAGGGGPRALPFEDDFACNGDTMATWKLLSAGKTGAKWAVDVSPAGELGIGCTLNFTGPGAASVGACQGGGEVEAGAVSPWLSLAGVGADEALVIQTHRAAGAAVATWLEYSFEDKADPKWHPVKAFGGRLHDGAATLALVPGRRDKTAKQIRFRLRSRWSCKHTTALAGPAFRYFRVLRSATPCATKGAGAWC